MQEQTNIRQPEATFISDLGIWKLLLSSSGLKDWVMSRDTPSRASSERETVCLKGQGRSGSNSPFMRVMKKSDEEGDMGAWTRTIPVEVDTQAQLVAMPRSEEWGNVYKMFVCNYKGLRSNALMTLLLNNNVIGTRCYVVDKGKLSFSEDVAELPAT